MEEAAWRPRGRLSRRRAPSGGGPPSAEGPSDPPVSPRGPSGGPQCPPSSGESELWAALLRAVHSDPILDSQPLPPLPTFPSQVCPWDGRVAAGCPGGASGPGLTSLCLQEVGPELPAAPEVFTVGTKAFTWTPFPPARGGPGHADRPLRGAVGPLGFPAPSLEGQHVPDPCGTSSPQQQLTKDGPLALRSCPLCQKEFTPELAQLDVDSHLAQCLAESTEDMEW
ncbi:Fanconi anemia core complex-associated protein 20 isoform 1-T1 [Erethizon dorsatum]